MTIDALRPRDLAYTNDPQEVEAKPHNNDQTTSAYVFFNACFLPLAKAAFIDQGPAKIMGGAIAALALYKGLPAAIDELKSAHQAATSANASAHPAFAQLVKDLVAMQESALKLAVDVKKSGGV